MAAKRTARGGRRKKDKLSNTIKNEIIGIVIVGIACLGIVLLYTDGSGSVAAAFVRGLKIWPEREAPGYL